MIVVDDDQNTSGERSPLKSPTAQNPGAPQSPPPPPPPPYAPHHHSYHTVAPGLPPPVTVLVLQRETPLKRFLKAFAVALLILALWSLFIDSLDMAVNGPHWGGGRRGVAEKTDTPHGLEWLINDWYKGAPPTSTPCSCSHGSAPATGIARALPVAYPPTARPQVELALPTSSTPSVDAAPTLVPQQS
ncbi:hypothetical protein BJ912DRAFT_1003763 [Pholiota molesta]|nr:hypothetical protein BJ912DRAFT_1003763 [Pholiota molesta]